MVVNKFELPNGNIYFYLGPRDEEVENVVLLRGGEVLFLKTIKTLDLSRHEIIEDIKSMDLDNFAEKYDIPAEVDLLKDLKAGIIEGEYPPFKKGP